MRLIDADAMEKTILDFWGCDPAYCMDLNGWDPAMADVCTLERLKNAPTVDAVPVRRAAWQSWEQDKPPFKWYSCDYCGFHALSRSNHCPNCGAKMDGGGRE